MSQHTANKQRPKPKSAVGAANTRRHALSTPWERFEAVLTYPGLYDFADLLPPVLGQHDPYDLGGRTRSGRQRSYPDLLMFALLICMRASTSQNRLVLELKEPGKWGELCDHYRDGIGLDIDLPDVPPTDSALTRFVDRLADKRPRSRKRWDAISRRLTDVGYGTARVLGNFADDHDPVDWTDPDHHHLIFGDGTYVKPLSDVLIQRDPVTDEEIPVGGTVQDPNKARVQRQFTDPTVDQKDAIGINHVTLSTWTDYGWVVLGTDHAEGAEIHPTMDLLDRILDLAGHRVHTVVWDRVLTGWAIQDLMATRRVMVINKPVARREDQGHFTIAGRTYKPFNIAHKIAIEQFVKEEPLPVGTSVYRTNKGHEVVRSHAHPLPVPKELAACSRAHVLVVDDGALFDCTLSDDTTDPIWWKRPKAASAVEAKPLPGSRGLWTLPIAWHLECPHAPGGRHEFTTHWKPAAGRAASASQGICKAIRDLRPVPRYAEATFAPIHGLRNITESFNQWFKKTLGQHKRAMHLDVEAQFVDHLCAGMLANAISYHRYLLCTDED